MGVITRLISVLLLVCVSQHGFAQGELPALTEGQAEALSYPVEPGTGLTSDNHYATLISNIGGWGNLMPLWNAQPELRPPLVPAAAFNAVGSSVFAEPGEPFVFSARFIRKASLAGRPNIERWVVNPYSADRDERGATPVVVFVDRRITGRIREPMSGWYILLATRAYRPTMVESVRGNALPTQSFVGAVFFSGPTTEGDLAGSFAWIGIAIAVVIAIGIVLGISLAVHLRRQKDQQQEAGTPP